MIPMLPDASAEQWHEFVAALRTLVEEVGDEHEVWASVPARNKVAFSLIVADRRDDLTAFLLGGGWQADQLESRVVGGTIEADFGRLTEHLAGVAPEAFRLSEFQTRLRSRTQRIRWRDDGRLELHGHAAITGLDPATHDVDISAELVLGDTRVPIEIGWTEDELRTASFATPNTDGTKAHFRLVVDPFAAGVEPGDWSIELTLTAGGISHRRID